MRYTNPVPHPSVIGRYYKSEEYISHSGTKKGLIARIYHSVRTITLQRKLKLVSRFADRGSLLDFGCGTGNFLAVCKNAGWAVKGIEPDRDARSQVDKTIPLFGSWQHLQEEVPEEDRFDVVTMWHVLEHIYDLNETLAFLKARLKKQGVLVVAVPNCRSRDAAKYGPFWAAYDVPRHLYHFDRETLARLAKNAGFVVESVLPMIFDSYYVSLLSEKYKGAGMAGMFRALFSGFLSNLAARRSGEYSSLIFILRHRS